MGNHWKLATTLLIVALTASSLITIESTFAQSIPKPPIPVFTLKLVEHLYDLPPVYEIDQFTGKNVTVREGAHYQWQTLDFIIENQQVQSESNLFFNIRYKGQFASNWTNLYHGDTYARAQSGQYSTISFVISGQAPSSQRELLIPAGAKVDFQVEAMIGGIFRKSPEFASGYEFRGETSGWSNTQTISIPDANSTILATTSTPTSTSPSTHDNQPETNDYTPASIPLTTFLLVTAVFIGIIAVLLMLLFQRHKKTANLRRIDLSNSRSTRLYFSLVKKV